MKNRYLLPLLLLPFLVGCTHEKEQPHQHTYTLEEHAPTCLEKGYDLFICDCGDTIKTERPALGHQASAEKRTEPTCTNEGLIEQIVCTRCDEILTKAEVLPAKGHTYANQVCTECGFVIGAWTGESDTSWYSSNQTSFTLYSAEQLAGLSRLVSEGNSFDGRTISLGADITLNHTDLFDMWEYVPPAHTWTPIGSNTPFSGTFLGNGYTISGAYGSSLFDLVEEAIISNFKLENSYFFGDDYIAPIGTAINTKIGYIETENTIVKGTNSYAGGIVAYQDQGSIGYCTTSGSVISNFKGIGGIAGYASGTVEHCSSFATVTCANEAEYRFGKLVGILYYGTIYTDLENAVGYNHGGTINPTK